MSVKSLSMVVVALFGFVSAIPLPRSTSVTSQNFMQDAISALLTEVNSDGGHFYALEDWTAVNFGSGAASVDGSKTTSNGAFLNADISKASQGAGLTYFSTEYINFVQELGKTMGTNKTSQKELDDAMESQAQSCGPQLVKALTSALQTYIGLEGKPVASVSDPGLVQWAQTQYAPYMEAHLECESATNSYNTAANQYFGDDMFIFSSAMTAVSYLTGTSKTATPGITMQVDGKIVPSYNIPVMNGTVSAWAQGMGLAPFSYDSSSSSSSTSQSSASDNQTQTILWGTGSQNGTSQSQGSSNSSTASFAKAVITLQSAAKMEVSRGWFDDWKAASALYKPADDIAKKGVPVFQKFFGSAKKPGPAAFYNAEALVGFRPKISIQLATKSAYSAMKSSHNSSAACIPYMCVSQQSSSSSISTSFHDNNSTIEYEDKSDTAYIFGYSVENFWDGTSTDIAGMD
ncbi:hypothetical protein D9757_010176 [Collybiopsis confluens]|uniref:Uncharacterized protein n=1 Tax=Collybiopsis confluens TaxID=2823264 RepID=A0A8H5H1A3_9AGAR|nr:hypothetical protein D9757_010176 [Collybiopsis confluens]